MGIFAITKHHLKASFAMRKPKFLQVLVWAGLSGLSRVSSFPQDVCQDTQIIMHHAAHQLNVPSKMTISSAELWAGPCFEKVGLCGFGLGFVNMMVHL